MKKAVKQMSSSPKVDTVEGRITAGGAKYSTGSAGRAYPSHMDKRVRKGGNPPGAPKR